MSNISNYIQELRFFIRGYEKIALILVILAIIIGIVESFSLALLYPMISVGFQISSSSGVQNILYEQVGSMIPMGSPFVSFGVAFILLTLFSLFIQLIYWRLAYIFRKDVIVTLKKDLFEKISTNDYQFFIDNKQGDLINLFNSSPVWINETFDRIISLCADLITSFTIIVMLFILSPSGLLFVMIGGGIFYIILHKIGQRISEQLGHLQIDSGQNENKIINEYVSGVKAIIASNSIQYWTEQYKKSIHIFWDKYAEYMFIQRIPIVAINGLFYIAIGITVLILYIYFSNDFIAIIPLLGTFAAATLKILPKFTNMGDYLLMIKTWSPHMDAVYQVLNDKNYDNIINGVKDFQELNSDIVFDNISFGYNHHRIFSNVDLVIKKGAVTALVGPSGSGKSTITALLLRLYDPIKGRITINNNDIKEFDIGSFRKKIGYVSQDPFIYNASIRDNITFGEHYSDTEIINAATLAYADEFITRLPDKYDTIVGDQGVKISGGEKQRLVIARAMIRHPDVLILDEATSALDTTSEIIVQEAIDNVAKECTTLVIAHRLSTIIRADNIYVLKSGVVVESGNHETLMEKRGEYYQLYMTKERM